MTGGSFKIYQKKKNVKELKLKFSVLQDKIKNKDRIFDYKQAFSRNFIWILVLENSQFEYS